MPPDLVLTQVKGGRCLRWTGSLNVLLRQSRARAASQGISPSPPCRVVGVVDG